MKLTIRNALLSAVDGMVLSGNRIWYHFDKYSGDISKNFENQGKEEQRRVLKSRVAKGLPDPSRARYLYGTYHLGISPHIYSYYHLLTDLLPYLIKQPKHPVLVPNFMPITYINFLKEIEFQVQILPPKFFFVEKLLIPKISNIDWNKKKIKIIKSFFNKKLSLESIANLEDVQSKKKIYISREMAIKRHLTNEDEFLPILKKYNFRKVFLEKMSIPDQVRLFRSISHLIAPHGAGLTNVLFASPNIKILEIRPVFNSGNFCFQNLFSLGWPNYEIIVPPQTGKFFLPKEELEKILLSWKN